MHFRCPKQIYSVEIESRSWRFAKYTDILCEIAAAAVTDDVGVVCGRADGYGFGGDLVLVTETMSDLLQLIPCQPDVVVEDHVVRRFGLVRRRQRDTRGEMVAQDLRFLSGQRATAGRNPTPSAS